MGAIAKTRDGWNIVSRLNVRRCINLASLYGSYYMSKLAGRPYHFGKPFTLSIEPTTSCNLRCPECPSGLRKFTRPQGMISMELYRRIIDQVAKDLFYLILYFQGEPYLHPLFFRMTEYAREKKIYTATSTNGHFLTDALARKTVESGLDRLIISMDGTTQSTYEKYRVGGSLEKVLEGTRNLVQWKRQLKSGTPHIILQFIAFSTNEHQLPEVRALSRDLGVDELQIKTAQLYNYEDGNPLIPGDVKLSRYTVKSDGRYRINNPLKNHCQRMWRGCVVTWDGLVVPCCFDKDAAHLLGDLKEQSFAEIWKGEGYRDFRKKVFMARKEIDICRNCTEK